jgi:hypothetical protein
MKKKANDKPADPKRQPMTLADAHQLAVLLTEGFYVFGYAALSTGVKAMAEGKPPEEAVAVSVPLIERGAKKRLKTWEASRALRGGQPTQPTINRPRTTKGSHR